MRSGVLYRLGMTVVIASSLIGLWSLFFPDSLSSAMNAVGDLTTGQSTTDEFAQGEAISSDEIATNEVATTNSGGIGDVDLRLEATETAIDARVRWAITVINDGPDTEAGPITLRGTLPPSASYVSSSGRDWLCTELDDGALVCNLSSALPAGERAELILLADATANDDLTYTAAVAGIQADADLANNVIAGSWTLPGATQTPDNEVAAGTETGDENEAATGSEPSPTKETLPRTGTGSTLVFTILGLALCYTGIRLTRLVPSLLQEFRQGPLWPGA